MPAYTSNPFVNESPLSSLGRFGRERLLFALRRWSPLIAAAAVAGALGGLGMSKLTPPEYRASAQLYLLAGSSSNQYQDAYTGQALAKSYVQLANADVVIRPAMERVGERDFDSFSARSGVTALRDTSVMIVSFRDRDPQHAADAANALAESFIAKSKTLIVALEATTSSKLDEQIAAVESDVRALNTQIAVARADAASAAQQVPQLEASRQLKQGLLAELAKTRDEVSLNAVRARGTVSLWQPATPPTTHETPRTMLNTVLGGVGGGVLALIFVVAIGYLRDRITDPDDVRARLGLTPLGAIHLGRRPNSTAGKLYSRDDPRSLEAEAFRSIRTSLVFASLDHPPRTILVTSAVPREGKSVVAANLALAFAEAGVPTTLVDADLRRPSVHALFGISADYGLTNLLAEPATPVVAGAVAGPTSRWPSRFRVSPSLLVIPSGPLPANPAEILSSAKMSALLKRLADQSPDGVVIVDTSPLLAVADPAALSTKVDGCIVVVNAKSTPPRAARRAVQALHGVHATILGAVLNKVSAGTDPSYGYYYRARTDGPGSAGRIPKSGRGTADAPAHEADL